MIHTFTCLNRHFCVDTFTGSVFELNELSKLMIEAYKNSSFIDINREEFFSYSKKELDEALIEVESLIREGILFSKEPFIKTPEFNGDIKSMCLHISHACNLSCGYCFAEGGDYGTAKKSENTSLLHMSISTAKKAIDFLVKFSGKIKNLEVDFFGGEPLLNLDVVKEAVSYARGLEKTNNKNFRFTFTTNALALDEKAIEFLNAEMEHVILSIDGRKDVHNSIRKTKAGSDSYDLVLKNSKKFALARGQKSYFVRGTFTADNLDFTNDVLALKTEGFDRISLEPVVLDEAHSLAIKKEHLPQIFDEYERLAGEYLAHRAKGDWFTFFHFNLNLYDGPCEQRLLRACGAGCSYVAIAPNGDMYPCHQFVGLDGFKIGNVDIGSYSRTIPIRFGDKNHILEKPLCKSCWARYYCGGGCVAASIKYNNKIAVPHELSCEMQKKRIECALAIWAIENQ